ncbi:MAG: sigma-70 family RNA polymerase sigma factor [Steroidobacteraceae bacterium]
MAEEEPLLAQLHETRHSFLALVDEIRPELHRYCARMTGSIADGEDVVQDTLARAYYELSALKQVPALRAWLFRIAHNRALDFLRRYERRMSQPLEEARQIPDEANGAADEPVLREQAMLTAISRFLELAPAPRSCVVLKDVLGHSLEDIAQLLGLSVPAVKAALHRGRGRLAALATLPTPAAMPRPSPVLARYLQLFNSRDWDGVRAMLAEDVRLDVVSVTRRDGRAQVGVYFANYDKRSDWRLAGGWLDGREVLLVMRPAISERPASFVEVTPVADSIALIRDYHHVPYITREADFRFTG